MDVSIFVWVPGVILLLFDLWVLASIWRTTKPTGTKVGWTALVVCLPVLGLVIWGIAGPRPIINPPSSPNHSKG